MSSRPGTVEYLPPPEPEPPVRGLPPGRWVRTNLFSSWGSGLLTLVFGPLLVWTVFRLVRFALVTAQWAIVEVNLIAFMVGLFPRDELWRPWAALLILACVVGLGTGVVAQTALAEAEARGIRLERSRARTAGRLGPPLAFVAVIASFVRTPTPILLIGLVVATGALSHLAGRRLPRTVARRTNVVVLAGLLSAYAVMASFGGVGWDRWGGLLLTMFLTVAGIALSFPLGVLLALGRRSSLPAVRLVCVVYIEVIRGVPLIALLFMGWLVLGFFLPPGARVPDIVTRALVIFVLFTAGYIAEIVRGGLQAVPHGQREAAMAVGLSPWKSTRLIVLPQALRAVIPAIVGQFISLFKDTSLVFVIGLLDLLRVAQTIPAQPRFLGQGLHTESLLFASFVYWVGSYWMSRESQRMEQRLGVGQR